MRPPAVLRVALGVPPAWLLWGRGAPRGYSCGGGDMGSRQPFAGADFWLIFLLSDFYLFSHGNSANFCGHGITPCDSLSALLTPCQLCHMAHMLHNCDHLHLARSRAPPLVRGSFL